MEIQLSNKIRWAIWVLIALGVYLVPHLGDRATVSLVTKVLIFGLLVASLDILVGYAGMWSFSHAAFFGLGAYAVGILTVKADIESFWITAPLTILITAVVAALFAFIALRTQRVYFLLITLAIGMLFFGMFNTSVGVIGELTGGSDGLAGIPYPDIGMRMRSKNFYYFVAITVGLCAFLMYRLMASPFGYALRGIRENEVRLKSLGYNTWLYKYLAYVFSAVFAGVAGLLYAHFNGYISPSSASVEQAGILWLMLIIGGMGSLWGAFIGAAFVVLFQYYVSSWVPEHWPLMLGLCFVVAIMVARQGIYPFIVQQINKRLARS